MSVLTPVRIQAIARAILENATETNDALWRLSLTGELEGEDQRRECLKFLTALPKPHSRAADQDVRRLIRTLVGRRISAL